MPFGIIILRVRGCQTFRDLIVSPVTLSPTTTMEIDQEIDSILYIAREISGNPVGGVGKHSINTDQVYRIPPLNANEGHRANDWGDLACPLWKGRLRIIENSKGVSLNLEDNQTGTFDTCRLSFAGTYTQDLEGECRASA